MFDETKQFKHKVKSQSDPDVVYQVEYTPDNGWTCDCMNFMHRHWQHGTYCKHIQFIIDKHCAIHTKKIYAKN